MNRGNKGNQSWRTIYIEFSLSTPDLAILRIRGRIRYDQDQGIKQRIIDTNELVRSIYHQGNHPVFEIFYIEEGKASVSYLDGRQSETFTIPNS
ncbi:hypothetical protein [Paenibacillus kribbensis]|uniref:hypothetical protein n=1 Tax=Paenibacillus kribbensis TaxID=172713 RepID=UPI00159F268D|nr:hypothetical protein [Paenibacillus kribbensis]